MSLRTVLTAAATLALASLSPLVAAPALAQEAPAASADGQADMATIQSAAQTLQAEIAQLAPRAEAIRNDASLSDADKRSRIEALASEKQPQIDAFTAVIGRFATAQARAQGGQRRRPGQHDADDPGGDPQPHHCRPDGVARPVGWHRPKMATRPGAIHAMVPGLTSGRCPPVASTGQPFWNRTVHAPFIGHGFEFV